MTANGTPAAGELGIDQIGADVTVAPACYSHRRSGIVAAGRVFGALTVGWREHGAVKSVCQVVEVIAGIAVGVHCRLRNDRSRRAAFAVAALGVLTGRAALVCIRDKVRSCALAASPDVGHCFCRVGKGVVVDRDLVCSAGTVA